MDYFLTKDKFLTKTEEQELKQVLKEKPSRDATLIELALATGMRAGEILALTPQNISGTTISIKTSKGGRYRELRLKKPLAQKLHNLITKDTVKLFPITYRRLAQIWDYYRPPGKPFHSLRHTAAMNIYRRTKDINLVKLILGHSSISTTEIYANYNNNQKVIDQNPL